MRTHLRYTTINNWFQTRLRFGLQQAFRTRMVVKIGNEVSANIRWKIAIFFLFFSFKIILPLLNKYLLYLLFNQSSFLNSLSPHLHRSTGSFLLNLLFCFPIRFLNQIWTLLKFRNTVPFVLISNCGQTILIIERPLTVREGKLINKIGV